MKRFIVTLATLLIATASHAQQYKDLQALLTAANSNPAKVEGADFGFPGFVTNIEVVTANDGGRVAAVSLMSESMRGSFLVWTTKMACAMPVNEAAKLNLNQSVDVQGKVINTSPFQEYNQLAKKVISGIVVVGNCSMKPASTSAVSKSTPSQKPTAVAPVASTVSSHCASTEKVVFSCSAGKKLISVCGSGAGVQYRFGPQGAPELNWPENPAQKDLVTQGSIMLAGGGGDYLRFNKGNTSYVVYSASSKSADLEGVAVEQGGKTLANVTCKQSATAELGGSVAKSFKADSKGFNAP